MSRFFVAIFCEVTGLSHSAVPEADNVLVKKAKLQKGLNTIYINSAHTMLKVVKFWQSIVSHRVCS